MRALAVLVIAALALGGYFFLSPGGSEPVAPALEQPAVPAPEPASGLAKGGPVLDRPEDVADAPEEQVARAEAATVDAAPQKPAAAAGRLVGRVVDAGGRGVSGAQVRLQPRYPWQDDMEAVTTEASADGSFSLAVSGGGDGTLRVGMDGFAPFVRSLSLDAEGQQDEGDLVLERGVTLAGVVRDSFGNPVEDAVFLASQPVDGGGLVFIGSDQLEVARSDSAGRFEILRQGAGAYRFAVRHADHPDAFLEGSLERAGDRDLDLLVELQPGASIAGAVADNPSDEELVVSARPTTTGGTVGLGEIGIRSVRTAEVQEDGTFELRGLDFDQEYRLSLRTASASGDFSGFGLVSSPMRGEPVTAMAGDTGVRLVYSPGSTLTFRVLDEETGEPLTDFAVEAGMRWAQPLRDEEGEQQSFFQEGLVQVPGLRPTEDDDTVSLKIEAVGYQPLSRDDIRLAIGQDLDLGALRLEPLPVVRVIVEDADGEPVQGAVVILEQHVDTGGGFSVRRSISIGDGGAHEEVRVGDHERRSGRTNAAGVCVLTSLPGEEVTLSVRSDSFARYESEPFLLPLDDDHEEEISLARGGSVLVTVLDPDGEPAARRKVEHRAPRSSQGQQQVMVMGGGGPGEDTRSDGTVLFEALEPGLHSFRVGKRATGGGAIGMFTSSAIIRGGQSQEDETWVRVEVLDGEQAELTLEAPATTFLEGRILEAGTPLAGATLTLNEPEKEGSPSAFFLPGMGGGPSTRTDGKGYFRLGELDAGEYSLRIEHPGRAMPVELDVTVREGGDELEVDLDVTIIEGRVLDPLGEPIAGIRVEAKKPSGSDGRRAQILMVMDDGDGATLMSGPGGEGSKAMTDQDGRFQLRGVQPDTDLVLEARGGGFQPSRSEELSVPAGALEDGVEIVMMEAGQLLVRVTGADGQPAGMSVVTARFEGEGGEEIEPKVQMARDGKASFEGLRPGTWSVTAALMGESFQDSEPTMVEVVAGEQAELPLQLP